MKWTNRLETFLDTCETIIWIGGFILAFVSVYLWSTVGFLAFLMCAVSTVVGVVFGLLSLSLCGTVVEISKHTQNTYASIVNGKVSEASGNKQETGAYSVSNSNADLLKKQNHTAATTVCNVCGTDYVKGAMYCGKCGNKLL